VIEFQFAAAGFLRELEEHGKAEHVVHVCLLSKSNATPWRGKARWAGLEWMASAALGEQRKTTLQIRIPVGKKAHYVFHP
jgi:hypothetical protein